MHRYLIQILINFKKILVTPNSWMVVYSKTAKSNFENLLNNNLSWEILSFVDNIIAPNILF